MKLSKFQSKIETDTWDKVQSSADYYDKLLLRLSSVAGCLAAYDIATRAKFQNCDDYEVEAELGEALAVITQIAIIWGIDMGALAKQVIETDYDE